MRLRDINFSMGAVATEDIIEGRMVLLTPQSEDYGYGSRQDLPGVKLPDTANEALEAVYLAAFTVTQQEPPIYDSIPETTGSERGGWSAGSNVPFNADIYMTAPSMLQGRTISSGNLVALHAGGVYTVTSGNFVADTNLVAGARVAVADTATDGESNAGKLKYVSTAGGGIGTVIEYDSTNVELTFRSHGVA